MHLDIDFSPQVSARLAAAARNRGVEPVTLLENLVTEHLPPIENTHGAPVIDAESAAVIALMDEWLASAPTDPEEIRQAEAEVDELMQNLNRNRIESGESALLP